ncbi:MAG TPA: hypothetical protein VFY83_04790 [Anaerolineales bacterium]|nr:hypothetical protein [Anaerolineales bacterium]
MLFLVDNTTDLDFLLVTLRENWDNMAADSPNQTQASSPVRIYRLSKHIDRPMDVASFAKASGLSTPGEHPLLRTARLLSVTQSALSREANSMRKRILHWLAG